MAVDAGHKETDKKLAALEKKLKATYKDAADAAMAKYNKYMADFAVKDEAHKKDVASGKWTQENYETWRQNQLLVSQQLADVRDTIAQDLSNTDKIAMSMCQDHQKDVYAINHNYGTFEIEKEAKVDTSYALYDHDTVERLMLDDPQLLPPPSAKKQAEIDAKDIAWNREKLSSAFTASILIGESIPDMAKRISGVASMDANAAIRNARTMTTGAESAGRVDSYKRATSMGIDCEQEWVSTLDSRTRSSHRALDGDRIKIGGKFSNGLRFPGDPEGAAAEVYNCRCTLVAVVDGIDPMKFDKSDTLKRKLSDPDITYEAWKGQHKDAYAFYGGDGLAAILGKTVTPHPASYWKGTKAIQQFLSDSGMSDEEFEKHVKDYNKDFFEKKKPTPKKAKEATPPEPEVVKPTAYKKFGDENTTIGELNKQVQDIDGKGFISVLSEEAKKSGKDSLTVWQEYKDGKYKSDALDAVFDEASKKVDAYGGKELFDILHGSTVYHPPSYWTGNKKVQAWMAQNGVSEEDFKKYLLNYNKDFNAKKKAGGSAAKAPKPAASAPAAAPVQYDHTTAKAVIDDVGVKKSTTFSEIEYYFGADSKTIKSHIFQNYEGVAKSAAGYWKKYLSGEIDDPELDKIISKTKPDVADKVAKPATPEPAKKPAPSPTTDDDVELKYNHKSAKAVLQDMGADTGDLDDIADDGLFTEIEDAIIKNKKSLSKPLSIHAYWKKYSKGEIDDPELDEIISKKNKGIADKLADKVKKAKPVTPAKTPEADSGIDQKALKKAETALSKAKQALADADNPSFTGIWKDPVTLDDYESKKDSIASKLTYFSNKMNWATSHGDTAAFDKFKKLYDATNEFWQKGKEYTKLKDKVSKAQSDVDFIKNPPKTSFDPHSFTDEAKKKARKFDRRHINDADKYHRGYLDSIWDKLTDNEKYGIWEYTHNSNPMNQPLSGYNDGWSRSDFVGLGKAKWSLQDAWRSLGSTFAKKFGKDGHVQYREAIKWTTKAIDKSSLPEDTYLVRGSDNNGFAGMIEGGGEFSFSQAVNLLDKDPDTLRKALVGHRIQNHAFTSCGMASGTGFSGEVSYKIYCPKGTHAIYAEPQSYYGDTISGEHLYKKGQSYKGVGQEAEVIIQRGTVFSIRDIRKNSMGGMEVELEVVQQPDYFKTGYEETYDGGKTEHGA